jgi:hypothetical protein
MLHLLDLVPTCSPRAVTNAVLKDPFSHAATVRTIGAAPAYSIAESAHGL